MHRIYTNDQSEKVLKAFDRTIIKRLFGFLKPYIFFVVLSFIALIISIASEMLAPILIQNAVDSHIWPLYKRIIITRLNQNEIEYLKSLDNIIELKDSIFIHNKDKIPPPRRTPLRIPNTGYKRRGYRCLYRRKFNRQTRPYTEDKPEEIGRRAHWRHAL